MGSTRVAALLSVFVVAVCTEARGVGLRLAQDPNPGPEKLSIGNSSFALDDFSDLTSCDVSSSAELIIIGSSAGVASASASCEAKSDATNAATQQVADFVDKTKADPADFCTRQAVEFVAESIGNAFAAAYTLAKLELKIEGDGIACVQASAEADAYATAFAKSILRDAVETERSNPADGTTYHIIEDGDNGLCLAASLSAVFAKAWAESKVDGCVDGTGDFVDEQISFSRSVQNAIARVVIEIGRRSCADDKDGQARLKAFAAELDANKPYQVDTEAVRVSMSEFSEGVAEASGGTLLQCDSDSSAQCCGTDTSACQLPREAGFVLKKGEDENCCCIEGLLPFYVQQ